MHPAQTASLSPPRLLSRYGWHPSSRMSFRDAYQCRAERQLGKSAGLCSSIGNIAYFGEKQTVFFSARRCRTLGRSHGRSGSARGRFEVSDARNNRKLDCSFQINRLKAAACMSSEHLLRAGRAAAFAPPGKSGEQVRELPYKKSGI